VENIVYQEMSPGESDLDWSVTRRVLSDGVLMKTLEAVQKAGEKHAVIALVTGGEMTEAYVSPQAAVEKRFDFDPVKRAFAEYDTRDGVCLLIIRDGKAAISLNGLRRGRA
jgi:hypothetical protein